MCNNMLELQEQLETTKTSLADSERKKRAAERQKKTLEDMNKRLAAETESSMDISGDEHESLLEELQKKNEELEKQQAGQSHDTPICVQQEEANLQLRHYRPLPGSLPAAAHLRLLVGQLLRGREAKVWQEVVSMICLSCADLVETCTADHRTSPATRRSKLLG